MGNFLNFLAYLSISLGVLNLLPIPVLDGGHLLFYLIELARGRPLSERVQAWGVQIGISLVVGVMLLALVNDLSRL
ncbi:Regulator of sigma-W protease RasP [compost metagenome]